MRESPQAFFAGNAVTVDGKSATVSGSTATVTISSVEYTLTITVAAYTATGALDATVVVTYDTTNSAITAVSVASASNSSTTYTITADDGTYTYRVYSSASSTVTIYTLTITIDSSGTSATYTYETYTYESEGSYNLKASYTGSGDSAFDFVWVYCSEESGIEQVTVNVGNHSYSSSLSLLGISDDATSYTATVPTNDALYEVTVNVDITGGTPTASYSYTTT